MNDKINIENYEAFYLDYLEGNLDDNLTLSLFAFLAENPELQVEDLGPELSDTTFVLDHVFKNNLKQNQGFDAISSSNIEYFLTAEKENQLSDNKLKELNQFVSSHPEYNLDRKIYALTSLSADESVVFADKKGLKRRETIVLWPFLSLLAAACAVLIVWIIPNSSYDGNVRSVANIQKNNLIRTVKSTTHISNAVVAGGNDFDTDKLERKENKDFITTSRKNNSASKLNFKKVQKFTVDFAENISFETLPERNPTAIAYQPTDMPAENSSTLAMKNPVKPITNKISDMIKTQVDYQSGENNVSQRKGFYLKIGQFEIYQNKKAKVKN